MDGRTQIAGGNHAAFTRGAQIFGWIKAEASDIADAAGTPSVIFGARCLRRVFDDYQLMAAGQFPGSDPCRLGVHTSGPA